MDKIRMAHPGGAVDDEMLDEIVSTLKSGRYILGGKTEEFEAGFANFLGCRGCSAVSSGTAALHLALLASGVGEGDDVITTPHTFIATVNSIVHCGARPVLADVDERTHNIDPEKIRAAVTKRTKAIIPVHIYGNPAKMDEIMEIAEKSGIKVIEDACQAAGAEYMGKKAGAIGDAGCFSFFPSKVMSVCGDGGMISSNDMELLSKASALRNQGRMKGEKYKHEFIGFNYRMSEIAAAIGAIELGRLGEWINRRREIAKIYNDSLSSVKGLETPHEESHSKPVYYVYTIRSKMRDGLKAFLEGRGIETGIYYPVPIHLQPAYRRFHLGRFPVAERIAEEILSLPIHQFMTDGDAHHVAQKVKEFFSKR